MCGVAAGGALLWLIKEKESHGIEKWKVQVVTLAPGTLVTVLVFIRSSEAKSKAIDMDLHQAAEYGELERVHVEQGEDKNKISFGFTPLYAASHNGHLTVVQYLVEQGADMEKDDSDGWTPLTIACFEGHLDVVRYLLEQGANRDKANKRYTTPLHLAAGEGHLEVTKLLMVYGADLNARNKTGDLPIDVAADEEISQAIRDEPRRRMDEAPGKRSSEHDQDFNADFVEQEEKQSSKRPAERRKSDDGEVADEDQDSEPSDEENN